MNRKILLFSKAADAEKMSNTFSTKTSFYTFKVQKKYSIIVAIMFIFVFPVRNIPMLHVIMILITILQKV